VWKSSREKKGAAERVAVEGAVGKGGGGAAHRHGAREHCLQLVHWRAVALACDGERGRIDHKALREREYKVTESH
jgi:hypothetical protein